MNVLWLICFWFASPVTLLLAPHGRCGWEREVLKLEILYIILNTCDLLTMAHESLLILAALLNLAISFRPRICIQMAWYHLKSSIRNYRQVYWWPNLRSSIPHPSQSSIIYKLRCKCFFKHLVLSTPCDQHPCWHSSYHKEIPSILSQRILHRRRLEQIFSKICGFMLRWANTCHNWRSGEYMATKPRSHYSFSVRFNRMASSRGGSDLQALKQSRCRSDRHYSSRYWKGNTLGISQRV